MEVEAATIRTDPRVFRLLSTMILSGRMVAERSAPGRRARIDDHT
jgi:hypothetical protein